MVCKVAFEKTDIVGKNYKVCLQTNNKPWNWVTVVLHFLVSLNRELKYNKKGNHLLMIQKIENLLYLNIFLISFGLFPINK